MDAQGRDERLTQALTFLPILCEPGNQRLLSAAIYFQRAVLLTEAGPGPSDFAGEVVVNLAKVLEAVFASDSRDKMRAGLRNCGYGDDLIESAFMSVVVLRSKLDAAHVRLAALNVEERRRLQVFVEGVLVYFRELLCRLIDEVENGKVTLPPYETIRGEDDELATLISKLSLPDSAITS